MADEQTDVLILQVELEDSDTEELDSLTRQLLNEIRELEVESAELVVAGSAPEGAKVVDPVTLGVIAVAVLPALLPKLIEFLQAWTLRGWGRTMKFKGKIGSQDIEFEGTPNDFKALLATLSVSQERDSKKNETSN